MKINWKGVYPAVTTQYNEDLSINFDATQTMINTIIKEGVDGIIALGTVGENASHTREEKIAILKAVKEVVAGRVPVLLALPKRLLSLLLSSLKNVKNWY
jgi:4-hydroxy-tetrahydrodipicolinate synthase